MGIARKIINWVDERVKTGEKEGNLGKCFTAGVVEGAADACLIAGTLAAVVGVSNMITTITTRN